MTYSEFMEGLYIKYHMSWVQSVVFIKFNKLKGKSVAGWEDLINLKIDAENILKSIKNKNMASALCLIAQGYEQLEVAEMLGKSDRTIRRYINRIKKDLKDNVLF